MSVTWCIIFHFILTGGLAPTSGGVRGGDIDESWLESLLISENGRGLGTTNRQSEFNED